MRKISGPATQLKARTNHERNALIFGHALGDLLHLLLVLAGGRGLLLELLLRLLLVLQTPASDGAACVRAYHDVIASGPLDADLVLLDGADELHILIALDEIVAVLLKEHGAKRPRKLQGRRKLLKRRGQRERTSGESAYAVQHARQVGGDGVERIVSGALAARGRLRVLEMRRHVCV